MRLESRILHGIFKGEIARRRYLPRRVLKDCRKQLSGRLGLGIAPRVRETEGDAQPGLTRCSATGTNYISKLFTRKTDTKL